MGKTTLPEGSIKCDTSVDGRAWLNQAWRSKTGELFTYCTTCGWVQSDCEYRMSETKLSAICAECKKVIRTRDFLGKKGGLFGG